MLFGGAFVPSIAQSEGEPGSGFRTRLEKWVEVRTLLSKERSDWLVEREYLESVRGLLQDERAALREEIKRLEVAQTGSDEERRSLALQRADLQQLSNGLVESVGDFESRVLAVAPKLPAPLLDRLEPLIVQIPDDPQNASVGLGQRLMNVLGVLSQTEKWNSSATLVGETRSLTDVREGEPSVGPKVQVRTLYWGLAQAIYVDAKGQHAGIGKPTPSGWRFDASPELAAEAKLLVDIYEGNTDTIAFVPIPVTIQ